jgi:hypothetical protein
MEPEKKSERFIKCERCETRFCKDCSAKAAPIEIHGKSYHRPTCAHHEKTGVDENFETSPKRDSLRKCPECFEYKNDKCIRPKDKVDGDIHPDEQLIFKAKEDKK